MRELVCFKMNSIFLLLNGVQKKVLFIVFLSAVIFIGLSLAAAGNVNWTYLLVILVTRLLIFSSVTRDIMISWEKSSDSIYFSKYILSFLSLCCYVPILLLLGKVDFLLLIADFALFTSLHNFAVSYKRLRSKKLYKKPGDIGIYGAGVAGIDLYRNLINMGYDVKLFIDDDPIVRQNRVDSVPVISLEEFKHAVDGCGVDEIIIAMPSLSKKEILNKYNQIEFFEGSVKMLPPLREILSDTPLMQQIEDVSLENYLKRGLRGLDESSIGGYIEGKCVLVTGAGGTIGSELSRQCFEANAKKLVLLDHSEYNLYKINEELEASNVVPILLSVVQRNEIDALIKKYKPDIILHAAAYKHVPLCESNIDTAVENNVYGTINLVDLAVSNKVKSFVMVSTDKAVRPTNIMGATKRICELYCQNVHPDETKIISVRFGNVLGSSGSVIPKFIGQINSGGPITVTHPDITRYFMLTSEACGLVLQAAATGNGGKVYILDMGDPIKIVDLAKQMIRFSGKKNIKIEFIGLRPGEKLYEELLIDDAAERTSCSQILIAQKTCFSIEKLNIYLKKLKEMDDKLGIVKEIVPEFDHQKNE